ncbi:EsaB/YukD family protein [Streptomyces sp. E11-3]|uniref:EsaB/YukD family protein n=1 Tax=Streptomyces sp. E11-3 TaxID=3110112 RepID=UPI00397EF7CB
MTAPAPESIPVILRASFGTSSWDISLPLDINVAAIIKKLIDANLGFDDQDSSGRRIPYRLRWKEGNRYLLEGETLRAAQVAEGHTLIMSAEARAGATAVRPKTSTGVRS